MSVRDAFNATWDTNVSGTHVLTSLAVPLLLKSRDPRLMFVTSGTSSLTETESVDSPPLQRINASPPKGWPKPSTGMGLTMYRSAKTGLNMLMREWVRTLKNDGVKVWCISPGFLATGLGGVGPEKLKAVSSIYCYSLATVGKFVLNRLLTIDDEQMGALDPSVGGQFVRDVVQGKRDQDVGKVIRANMIQPW